MTLQEILKSQGLSDEQIETVTGEMKQNKIYTAGEENLDIRYSKLKTDHDNLTAQHGEATALIEQLKAGTKNSDALQGKVTEYEAKIAELTKQLEEQRIDAAMDRELTEAGAKPDDFDYLKFQWRKKGEITLDEAGKIKGCDDAIAGLKTQHPVQFATAVNQKELLPQRLPNRADNGNAMTKGEFLRKPYAERAAFAAENPEAYKTIMNK